MKDNQDSYKKYLASLGDWCCSTFKHFCEPLEERDRERGSYIYIEKDETQHKRFHIEERFVQTSDEPRLREMNARHPERVVDATRRMAIKYCPWCGRDLYRKYEDGLPEWTVAEVD